MKQNKIFTPLNISYPIQKYSNLLIVGGIGGVLVAIIGIIITFKIKSDLAFSPIFGTGLFGIVGSLASLYAGLFLFRKVGLREGEQMRLYTEMLDHELTTINDLWEIIAIDNCIATYADNSSKIFLKCEKGYVISRPTGHDEIHRTKVEQFMKYLLDKGYYIDYYNWRDRNANTAPLDALEGRLANNPNSFLRDYGNAAIKFCRQLESECTDSEIEYFVICSRNPNASVYLESSVEAAAELLQGSLYEDIQICDIDGIIEFLEEINKIKGINVSEMLSGNVVKTEQKVVHVLKVIGATTNVDTTTDRNEEEELAYQQFLLEFQQMEETRKSSKPKRNLAQTRRDGLKPIPLDGNNIVEDTPIPIPSDIPTPIPITSDMPTPVDTLVETDDEDNDDLSLDEIAEMLGVKSEIHNTEDDDLLEDDELLEDD